MMDTLFFAVLCAFGVDAVANKKWREIVLFITSTRKLFNKNFHLISLVIKFSVSVKLFVVVLINISLSSPRLTIGRTGVQEGWLKTRINVRCRKRNVQGGSAVSSSRTFYHCRWTIVPALIRNWATLTEFLFPWINWWVLKGFINRLERPLGVLEGFEILFQLLT